MQQIVKWGEIVCVELKNKKNYNREKFFIKKNKNFECQTVNVR